MTKKALLNSGAVVSPPAECMTIEECAQEARLSRRQIYNLIGDRKLKARKIGRSTRVLRSDYSAFLRGLPTLGADRAA